MEEKISAVILAAGISSRMGRPKQLIELKGKKMLDIVIEKMKGFRFNEIILVLGHLHEEIKRNIDTSGIKLVINENYNEGISSSIRKAVSSLKSDSEAILIHLADKPLVKQETIKRMIEVFKSTNAKIIIPIFNGIHGHPVIFKKELFRELKMLKGDEGARVLINKRIRDCYFMEVDDEGVIIDIDTPEDLRSVLKKLEELNRLI